MKITLTALDAGAEAVELCHGDARNVEGLPVGPGNLRASVAPGVIDREYIGAEGVEPEHVGCDRATLTFSVVRTFTTTAAAQAANIALKTGVPRVGAVRIDGTVYMARAKVSYISGTGGCSLFIEYSIEGY